MEEGYNIPLILVLIAIFAVSVAGMLLQLKANKHKRPDAPPGPMKDAFFRRKHEIFTDEGMRYVEMQKKLLVVLCGLAIAFYFLTVPPEDAGEATEETTETSAGQDG